MKEQNYRVQQLSKKELLTVYRTIAPAHFPEDELKPVFSVKFLLRRKGGAKKAKITSKPFHYISSDGYHMYVGKNNFQNDELTFKFASGNDWWFHAKGLPGSHVIVKVTDNAEVPDSTFEEAGRLAAYYSKGREQEKVDCVS